MRFPNQVANNKKGAWYVTYWSNKPKPQSSIVLCMRITRGRQHLEAPCYVTLGTFATPCTCASSRRCCNEKDRRVIESWALLVKQTQAISHIWRFPKIRGTFLGGPPHHSGCFYKFKPHTMGIPYWPLPAETAIAGGAAPKTLNSKPMHPLKP